MGGIEIISASAGSGKTYRLSTLLREAIERGDVRPEAVVATTFTNKAAAELQERVRARLLQAGCTEQANRLGAARMGTVNAVCGRLLGEFAFELGLRPDLKILEPELATLSLERALSDVVESRELARLAELEQRMPDFQWKPAVQKVLELARTNGIEPAALGASADRSVAEMEQLLGESGDGAAFDAALVAALDAFVVQAEQGADATKATADTVRTARDALVRLRRGQQLPWSDWVKLAALTPGARSRELAVPVREAAAAHDRHPRLRHDLGDAIRIVFSLAARALDAYAAYKRAWGSIDFVDQEVLALQLLRDRELSARLEGEIDLVLVDEFQDSSPLQLAIFLELSRLSRRSVWVGDQKQAIYGFRGTDPALMDAAIAAVLGDREPETLGRSYRSRPELVRLTSDLFVPSFARHGLAERRVRLAPAEDAEPEGLGAVAERWTLAAKNQAARHAEVAACVRQMLADPDARVRDRTTGEARRVRPGDIAVLCCKNDTCTAVAHELAALGIRAVLPRPGLLATHEGQAALAALRLWVDPSDALAMAQLGQITEWAGRPDEWLAAAVATPGAAAFADLPIVRRIRERREQLPLAGAVASLDAALEAAGLRELCLRWGDSEVRQANLDALRAQAAVHEARCAEQGVGCTAASLVTALETLASAGLDQQAFFDSDDAVVLSTWHRAKGLEWPVTVLYELEGMRADDGLGVRVVSESAFDLAAPLAGRWIRFWPHPYHPNQSSAPFHARLEAHPALGPVCEQDERQRLRLFYVGWTRARDRLVLAGATGRLASGMPALIADDRGPLLGEPVGDRAVWAGRDVAIVQRAPMAGAPAPLADEPGAGYVEPGPRAYPPASVSPSALHVTGRVGEPVAIGGRAPLSGKPDMNHLGEAVHAFLAAMRSCADEGRIALAADVLRRWGVPDALQPADVAQMGESLERWVRARWPDAVWRREWPVLRRLPDGSVLRGTIDLLLETGDGLVVIDHKSFPGDREHALERAKTHAGQLAAYADAVGAATGRPVIGRFVHLPISGWMVPLEA